MVSGSPSLRDSPACAPAGKLPRATAVTLLLSACVDTSPWPGPEEMVLELVGRFFPLLGQLPIIPQQTLRSTLLKETGLSSEVW